MKIRFTILLVVFSIAVCQGQNKKKKLEKSFDLGKVENNKYQNSFFDMELTFNPEWIVQSKEQTEGLMKIGEDLVSGDNEDLKKLIKAADITTAYLFTIFKYELGAPVEYNPALILIAENTEAVPGIKSGEDYLFHCKKLLKQTQLNYEFNKEIYSTYIDKREFGVLEVEMDYLQIEITQEYITTLINGFCLSFIISYTNKAERQELYEILNSTKFNSL